MCTVTFAKTPLGICVTSSRDENIARPKAIAPKTYIIGNQEMVFPKDALAGGTWIAHTNNQVVVLLNGANENHTKEASYRKSRGLVVLDLLADNTVVDNWNNYNLENIEPFTLVVYSENNLYQLQWNGITKSTTQLNTEQAHIWSSATLYSSSIRGIRRQWFFDFLNSNNPLTAADLLHFHKNTQAENSEYGLRINRENGLKTVSITQVLIENNTIKMHYYPFLNEQIKTVFP